jgi:hypothetical protein
LAGKFTLAIDFFLFEAFLAFLFGSGSFGLLLFKLFGGGVYLVSKAEVAFQGFGQVVT